MDASGVKAVLRCLHSVMVENRDRLIDLDRVLGDGDLGLTMVSGFGRAAEELAMSQERLPGKLLARAGAIIASAAPSTMGNLIGTGFLRGGKAVGDAPWIGTPEAAAFFRAMTEGIMDRGKTRPGEKTVVDALFPAVQALEQAVEQATGLTEAISSGWEAARRGAQAAIAMKAKHGRAAYFQEQSIGKEDPGAWVGVLILQAFHQHVSHTAHENVEPAPRPAWPSPEAEG
ncbi:MAG: dihydroxyacetone kinase subunit DhaL [Deltaproteobacteria bacterium]|nr:dihydroxyacetone kinase subunit DhaL [Deltaproteobacteria bacterium]